MKTLYHYYRSSCSYRVRIALNYKGIEYQGIHVNLLKDEQKEEKYMKKNPMKLVPTFLEDDVDIPITQSFAILEYLEEAYPEKPLLPQGHKDRAVVRGMAQIFVADTQPILNLRVLKYLVEEMKVSEEQKLEWIRHFMTESFDAYEELLRCYAGTYSYGESLTMADVCLVPQIFNAKRFQVDLNPYLHLNRVYENLLKLEAVQNAAPEKFAPQE